MTGGFDSSKGFSNVDEHGEPDLLVGGMDETGQWPAVRKLRAWEREQLSIEPGQAILDVGCGAGDVLIDLAAIAAPGQAIGVDASEQMLAAGRARAAAGGVDVTFAVGDATALEFPDGAFDVVRSERTLQWVSDPAAAVREMVRVARPGGRVCITDTDWGSMLVEHPRQEAADRFFAALGSLRGDQTTVGRRLVNLLRDAGARDVIATAETHLILDWDPDQSPHIPGFFPVRVIADDFVAKGLLSAENARLAADGFEDAARGDRLFVSLTMFAVAGTVPQR